MTFLEGDDLLTSTGGVTLEAGQHPEKHNEARAALLALRDELLPDKSTLTDGDLLQWDASGDRLIRLDSGTYPLATETPTLEELTASSTLATNITFAYSFPLWIAPFACTITQASLVVWSADIAASDTDYWTISISRTRANAGAVFAVKTTQATGGEAIDRRTDWNFDAVAFDGDEVLQKGDIVNFIFSPTGSPTGLNVICMTVRYEPS